MDRTHMNSHNLLFVTAVILLIYVVLTTPLSSPETHAAQDNASQENGVVCCTFTWQNTTKTCAATLGQSCDACERICDARNKNG
jgi:hypothetical protein